MKKILLFTVMCVLGLFGTLKAQDVVTIDGTVGGFEVKTDKVVPIYNNYDYAITQFYYTVDEIAKANGTIESIAFKTVGTGQYPYTRNLDVYMVNTDEYYFDPNDRNGKGMKQVSASDLVFSGEVEFTQDSWVKIDLATDFEYTGGNLLLCVNDKTGDYISGDANRGAFSVFSSTYQVPYQGEMGIARRALYQRNTGDAYDPTASAIVAYGTSAVVPFIQLTFAAGAEEFLEPAAPANFKVRAVSESKINLSWDAAENAQSYEIISGTENIATVTETSYSIKNLKLGKYEYSVRSVNGSKYSDYVDGSVELVAKDIDSIQIGQERTQTGIGDPVSSETIPFGFNMGTTAYSWVEIPYSASLFEEGFSIDRISFDFEHGGQAYLDEIRIYLAEKTKENAAEWTAEKDLELVFSDTDILIGEDKWEKFEFEKSFEYKAKEDLIVVVATAKNGANVWTNRSSWYFDKVENNTLYRLGEDASCAQYPTEAGTQHYARPVVQFAWEVEEVIIEAPVLKATATSDSTVLLAWNAVDSAVGYSVYKNDSILLADYVDTTEYTVLGLEAETEYSFKVQAFNKYGDVSKFSKVVNVKTLAKDGGATTPASPVVEAKVANDSTVVLIWDKVVGADSYNVYQDTVVLKKALLDTTYTVTNLIVDSTYTFEVTAVNEVGESKRAKVEVLIPSKEDEGDDEGDEGEDEGESEYLIYEDFEDYEVDARLAQNNPELWTTWNNKPGTKEDASVDTLDGNKFVHFVEGVDQILLLGDYTNGCYEIKFDLYVPNGKNAYYNILHDFAGSNSDWALQQYVHMTDDGTESTPAAGHGTTHAGGNSVKDVTDFVFDTWMTIRYVIDIDHDVAKFYLSTAKDTVEKELLEWQWSRNSFNDQLVPTRKLDAMNFFPPKKSSEFYLDNLSLKRTSGEAVVELDFGTETLKGGAMVNDIASVEFTVENTGTTVVDYTAWIDYGVSETASEPFFVHYDEDLNDSTTVTGLNLKEPTLIEVGAMYPAAVYASAAAGTKVTHLSYPFAQIAENSGYGIVKDSDVIFRIYGQGFNGQPGEVLAEKAVPYSQIEAGKFLTAEFDTAVVLTGFNVWATVSFMHAVPSQSKPQYPIVFDGISTNLAPYGNLIRIGNEGAFTEAHTAFQKNYGNIHIRMTCAGEAVDAGWAELGKVDGALVAGAKETINVDFNTFGLEAGKFYNATIKFALNNAEEMFELPLSLQVWGEDIDEVLVNTYSIYPNPTSGMVTIEGENINYVAVYNSLGQLVKVVRTQDNVVDMSTYENGVYFFNVVDNAGTSSVQRVVVAK